MVFRKKRNYKKKSRPGYRAMKSRYNRKRKQVRRGDRLTWKPHHHNPMPLEYLTKFRAIGQGYLPSGSVPGIPVTTSATGNWYFNNLTMNSLYQPFSALQTASVNHINSLNWATNSFLQPVGFLTLCNSTTYRNYQVLACKVKVTFYPGYESDRFTVCMSPLSPGSGAAVPTSITAIQAEPWAKTKVFNVGETTRSLSMYVDFAKYLGIDKKVFRNDTNQYAGYYAGNPTTQIGLAIVAQTSDHNSPTGAIGFKIEYEWYTRLWNQETNLLI